MTSGVAVRLEGLRKVFRDGTEAVRGVDLEAGEGELLVLVGPSGSGKSTVLRMVAGLDSPTEGRVLIAGEDVTGLEPRHRDVAMVFQSYALYPHKTVRENLAFGLRVRRRPAGEIRERVEAAARTLGLSDLLERRPAQLSGGERQRVALGRAIVRRPRVFLLDEPLSNLDPALRHRTRTELARLHRRLGVTMLYVTHDQEEAMTLGDRVAVLRAGRLEQVAPPMDLYRAPGTRFVAAFIGSPAMNLLRCRVRREGEDVRLDGDGVRLHLLASDVPALRRAGGEVDLGVRPHDVRLAGSGEPPDLRGVVDLVEPRGSEVVVRLRLEAQGGGGAEGRKRGENEQSGQASLAAGTLAMVLPSETPVGEGDVLPVRFPRERLHFFDPGNGRRLG